MIIKIKSINGVKTFDIIEKCRTNTVKKFQRQIQELEDKQDKLFKQACKELKIPHNKEPEATILFDVLYNKTWTPAQVVKRLWHVDTAEVKKRT